MKIITGNANPELAQKIAVHCFATLVPSRVDKFADGEVSVEFLSPGASGSMFPTGNLVDDLEVPGIGVFKVTMINAGIPTIFLNAQDKHQKILYYLFEWHQK